MMALTLGLALACRVAAESAQSPGRHIQCAKTTTGLDYAYGDLRMIQAADSAACCAACEKEPACVLWVKDTTGTSTGHDCFLKKTFSDAPCSHAQAGQPCRRSLAGRESMTPTGPAPPIVVVIRTICCKSQFLK